MNIKFKIISIIGITCFLIGLSQASSNQFTESQKYNLANEALRKSNNNPVVSLENIINLVQSKKYTELESILKDLESSYESDTSNEWPYIMGYEAFGDISDASYDKMIEYFNEWVNTKNSYISYAARGFYISGEGFRSRGTEYINNVSSENRSRADALWNSSLSDLNKSIELNPKLVPSYSQVIKILRSQGKKGDAEKALNSALSNSPETYYIRSTYLNFLQPKWGGSYDEENQFIEKSQVYGEKNPRIWALRGLVNGDKAYQCLLDEDYSCAIELYSKALVYGDKYSWLYSQAYAYYEIGDYSNAIKNMERIAAYTTDDTQINYLINILKITLSNHINSAPPLLANPNNPQKVPIKTLGWSDFKKDW